MKLSTQVFAVVLGLCVAAVPAMAQLQMPARQVSASTTAFSRISPTTNTVQGVMDWLDDHGSFDVGTTGAFTLVTADTATFGALGANSALFGTTTTGTGTFYRVNTTNLDAGTITGGTATLGSLGANSSLFNTTTAGTGIFYQVNTTNLVAYAITLGGVQITSWPVATAWGLTADTTLNLTAALDSGAIQALIEAVPKNLNGKSLTVNFADGTYNFTNTVLFSHFVGGSVLVQGTGADATSPRQTQMGSTPGLIGGATIRPNSLTTAWAPVLGFYCCQEVTVRRMHIQYAGATNVSGYCTGSPEGFGIVLANCASGLVSDNFIEEDSAVVTMGDSVGILSGTAATVRYNTLSAGADAVYAAYASRVYAADNASITPPGSGYRALTGSMIGYATNAAYVLSASMDKVDAASVIVRPAGAALP